MSECTEGLSSTPIAIMSFNRPLHLEKVLISLKAQTLAVAEKNVHLFQDGARSEFGECSRATPEEIAACIASFRRHFPNGVIHEVQTNLGIALNFERAERFFFEDIGSDLGVFLEDDLVLSPHYLDALYRISDFALNEDRVGYVAAYGMHNAPLDEQFRMRRSLVPMSYNWGFALTRRQWRRQREIVDGYLDLVRGGPYRQRPANRIQKYFASLGVPMFGTSQDAAKEAACAVLGAARLMCFPAYGHYIGDVGEHYTPDIYKSNGFAETVMFSEKPNDFDFPPPSELASMVADARKSLCNRERAKFLADTDEKIPTRLFLRTLYWGLLDREPDEVGYETFSVALDTGSMRPIEVLRGILESEEFLQKTSRIPGALPDNPVSPVHRPMEIGATSTALELQQRLYGADIYAGFSPISPKDLQGWNSQHPALEREISARRPRIIIDVGVWKGASTINMAKRLRDLGVDGAVIAVDTFLGSSEHWNRGRPDRIFEDLKLHHGWPSLYWQFLSNVMHEEVSAVVVPLSQTSENAAVILQRLDVKADIIHIDAAHEYEAVLRDARIYWNLLKPGGVLIGNDYPWLGVARAAHEFALETGQDLRIEEPKWLIEKPA